MTASGAGRFGPIMDAKLEVFCRRSSRRESDQHQIYWNHVFVNSLVLCTQLIYFAWTVTVNFCIMSAESEVNKLDFLCNEAGAQVLEQIAKEDFKAPSFVGSVISKFKLFMLNFWSSFLFARLILARSRVSSLLSISKHTQLI